MSNRSCYIFLLVLCMKGLCLLADWKPAYFLGDSEAYLATATVRYIPPDRSFMYGLLIRRIAYRLHSLEAMIVTQVFLSAIAAALLWFVLRKLFSVGGYLAVVLSIVCSVEPLQLLAERYVLTEASANCLFVLHLALILLYIKRGRLWVLLIAQATGVL